jgi:hypothetical protein
VVENERADLRRDRLQPITFANCGYGRQGKREGGETPRGRRSVLTPT